jgi:hypothetical protein
MVRLGFNYGSFKVQIWLGEGTHKVRFGYTHGLGTDMVTVHIWLG